MNEYQIIRSHDRVSAKVKLIVLDSSSNLATCNCFQIQCNV